MKVSEITVDDLKEYLMIDDANELVVMLVNAKAYIRSYTGLTVEEMDTHEDLVHVVYVLVSDMYDNRALMVSKNYANRMVESILNLYSTNLL